MRKRVTEKEQCSQKLKSISFHGFHIHNVAKHQKEEEKSYTIQKRKLKKAIVERKGKKKEAFFFVF